MGVLRSVDDGENFQRSHPEILDKPQLFRLLVEEKAQHFSESQRREILDDALSLYFGEPEETMIRTFQETCEVLSALASDYDLYLVSLGNPIVQQKKVKAAGLNHFFKHAWFPDFKTHANKETTFQVMLEMTRIPPERVLCIGNRIDHEICNGKALGMKTCWIEYGEHVSHRPQLHHEMPDYTIPSIRELISTCRL